MKRGKKNGFANVEITKEEILKIKEDIKKRQDNEFGRGIDQSKERIRRG